jgi:hypothetical protein
MGRTVKCLIFALVLSALALLSSAKQSGGQQSNPQDQAENLIKEAISIAGNLKEGSIRSEVERDFVLDGGIQSRGASRYMFKKCRFIKIDVTFSKDENSGTWIDGSPNDKVISVSKPYLEYPVMD